MLGSWRVEHTRALYLRIVSVLLKKWAPELDPLRMQPTPNPLDQVVD